MRDMALSRNMPSVSMLDGECVMMEMGHPTGGLAVRITHDDPPVDCDWYVAHELDNSWGNPGCVAIDTA